MKYHYDDGVDSYAAVPSKTWWQAMPWLVRAAIWFTALCVFLPIVIFGALAAIGILVYAA